MRHTQLTAFIDQYEDRNFYQLTYPEDYIFAQSRHTYIQIDRLSDADNVPNSGGLVKMEVTDTTANKTYTESRYLDQEGRAVFDIARFLQIFMEDTVKADVFTGDNINSTLVIDHNVTVRLWYSGTWFWTLSTFEVVNGADEVTDNWWFGQRRLRWWKNYPFTFDFRNLENVDIEINDSGLSQSFVLPQITTDPNNYGRIRVNANRVFTSAVNKAVISTNNGMQFIDGSFYSSAPNAVAIIGNSCPRSDKDVYLRWFNRHGELSYWLFKRHSLQRKFKATDNQRAYIKDERIDPDSHIIDNALLRALTVEGELKCYTDALDGIDYEIVRQLFTAPFVDLYLPEPSVREKTAVWQRVHIKPETQAEALRHADLYTYNRQVTVTLTMPEEGQIFV